MSSFCSAKANSHFFSKKFQHICVSLDANFNESLTNDIVSFEQLGPGFIHGREKSAKKIFFSRSGNCQGILKNVREIIKI